MKSSKNIALSRHLTKPSMPALYGTAGYRLNTTDLNNVLCRASIISYIRSATFAGKYIGLYITASHNPEDYNGIKFIDFNGDMLDEAWEAYSDDLVNCEDADFKTIINKIFRANGCYSPGESIRGKVIIGRDTRESGLDLYKNIKEVLEGYKCTVYTYDEVSCPQMHFLVRKCNERGTLVDKGEYLAHLLEQFNFLGDRGKMGVDTANGVGKYLIEDFNKEIEGGFEILNDSQGILNKNCGADYIKTIKKIPIFENTYKKNGLNICGAFDGDVDRLIIFTSDGRIFDGDAQCVFISELIKDQLNKSNIKADIKVVLSHYSNMGAIDYLRGKGFVVVLAQTGVKNFVKEAKSADIGIYFEPNGHGSVIFSKRFVKKLEGNSVLKTLTEMFDPCIGDAFANLLVFKGTLGSTDDLIRYKENCTRLMTVKIANKNVIKVDQNNKVLEPDIQRLIDEACMVYKGSRAFVRPSGTEDLVRVFAEAPVDLQCDKLALNVAQIVYDTCEGVGNHPEIIYK